MKKIKDCGTCRFQKTPSKSFPCNSCKEQASGYVTSMWKAKKGTKK